MNRPCKETERRRLERVGGFSIVEVMIMATLASAFVYGLINFLGRVSNSRQSLSLGQDLEFVKLAIETGVHCDVTFDVKSLADLPKLCSPDTVVLRHGDGTPLKNPMGNWRHRASCLNDALHVEVQNITPDPATKQIYPWRSLNKPKSGETAQPNLACANVFRNNVCGAGRRLIGMAGVVPVCSTPQPPPRSYEMPCVSNETIMRVNHRMCSLAGTISWSFSYKDSDGVYCRATPEGVGQWALRSRCWDVNGKTPFPVCHFTCLE